jgi:hypothetical protein
MIELLPTKNSNSLILCGNQGAETTKQKEKILLFFVRRY